MNGIPGPFFFCTWAICTLAQGWSGAGVFCRCCVIYVHQGQIFVPGSNICPRVITMYLVLSQDPVMGCQGSRRIFLVPFMPQFLVSFDILLTDVRPNICSHICLILLLIF
jgi:hypothetical protein